MYTEIVELPEICMTDMLVKLYDLPELAPRLAQQRVAGIDIRRALASEKHLIVAWAGDNFSKQWASECDVSFSRQPTACFIAVREGAPMGFACYDVVCKGFFGPTGVNEAARGQGIGTTLLLACLHDMAAQGYGYGIIGWIGPEEFYARTVGAITIPDSSPSVFRGILPYPPRPQEH